MKNLFLLIVIFLLFSCAENEPKSIGHTVDTKYEFALVLHGGAGTIKKENMTDEEELAFRASIDSALEIGRVILEEQGGSALDAVQEVVIYLEDNPRFNAGRGAVFTSEGTNELDAAIMDGATGMAGALTGVTVLPNPIIGARKVMEASEHVMFSGEGANTFCIEQGMDTVHPSYFYTQFRWDALERARGNNKVELDHDDKKHGTVGVVALDKHGNIAAGTSTGGMTNKRYGRVGDSPIIGAGTFAMNATCGVSCTGHGEYFIRDAVAYAVSAQMEYGGKTLQEAADYIIHEVLKGKGGSGGLVALDRHGNIAMPFNTAGMYRGYVRGAEKFVGIYKDEN